jgi:carbonic anhydrase/acetyltransferase-like protein (isoleucine patch superfamily)
MFPHSLSFEPINTDRYSVSGDVTIFPGAAIAPGVLLQADVGSRIVIRAGVCIGLGSVLHASHGTITVNDGANLGAGVLLVGDVSIGARACLGAAVTVINASVEARKILESGTVVGDRSRRESIDELIDSIPMNSPNPTPVSTTTPVSTNGYPNSSDLNSVNSTPIVLTPIVPTPIVPTPIVPTPIVPTPIVSTFKYPESPTIAINSPALVVDNSGKPWQTCDTNPWDPTNHPPGETTCQITSKPKDPTPFNNNLFSDQNHSSPYPPYPQPVQTSTPTISTFVDPNPTIVPEPVIAEPIAPPEPSEPAKETPSEPKPVYGQDYVNRMLGKMSGRS